MLVGEVLFAALNLRWTAYGLKDSIPGGWSDSEAPEGTARPYLVVKHLSEATQTFSNISRYETLLFEVSLYLDKKEDSRALFDAIDKATANSVTAQDNPLVADPATPIHLMSIRPGAARYEEVDTYWVVTREYQVRSHQPDVKQPSQ